MASIVLGGSGGAGDLDLRGAKLGVVEEKGSLCSSLLLESYGCFLGLAGFSDLEVGDLATRVNVSSCQIDYPAEDQRGLLIEGARGYIFPQPWNLLYGVQPRRRKGRVAYQKLKKSLTSFSPVVEEMFLT